MGVFDSVFVICPHCGQENVDFQSKAGVCALLEYNLNNCPASIAEDLNGKVEKCPKCGLGIVFKSQIISKCWVEKE